MLPFQFHVDDEANWRPFLDVEGYCVLTDVVSDAECARAEDLFLDFVEEITENRFNRESGKSWKDNLRWPKDQSNGIVMEGSIQHTPYMWFSRTRPKVMELYKKIYGEEDLVVSFDRGNAVRNVSGIKARGSWFHHDYPAGYGPYDWQCYQSFINYVDCSKPGSPCLRVLPRSHERLPEVHAMGAKFRIKIEQMGYREERDAVEVLAPKGSLVLWKCGVIHDAKTDISRSDPSFGNFRRLTAYVTYAPLSCASKGDLQKRARMFFNGDGSGHWPIAQINWVRTRQKVSLLKDHAFDAQQLLNGEWGPLVRRLVPVAPPRDPRQLDIRAGALVSFQRCAGNNELVQGLVDVGAKAIIPFVCRRKHFTDGPQLVLMNVTPKEILPGVSSQCILLSAHSGRSGSPLSFLECPPGTPLQWLNLDESMGSGGVAVSQLTISELRPMLKLLRTHEETGELLFDDYYAASLAGAPVKSDLMSAKVG